MGILDPQFIGENVPDMSAVILPEGTYTLRISKVEQVSRKSGLGENLVVDWVVVDNHGDYDGVPLRDYYAVPGLNDTKVVRKSKDRRPITTAHLMAQKINSLLQAVGLRENANIGELTGRTAEAHIAIDQYESEDGDTRETNRIRRFV